MSRSGLSDAEVARQVELLRSPPAPAALERPCTVGDGLRVLADDEQEALQTSWRAAAEESRFSKFVPASGAASRMFSLLEGLTSEEPLELAELSRRADRGDRRARSLLHLVERLEDLPFREELELAARRRGLDPEDLGSTNRWSATLATVLDPDGLGYAMRAKGLIPFHRYPDGSRSAMVEHFVEGAAYLLDRRGRGRIHFTVGEAQRADFERAAAEAPQAEAFDVSFSTQHPSTDTVCIEDDGTPVRDAEGELVLRPGGHGALLVNLERLDGDLVYIKNIDNVVPESRQADVVLWQRLLGGLLARIEGEARTLLERLRSGTDEALLREATAFCRLELSRLTATDEDADADARRDELIDLLDRPLRVCGMVPSTGEPGGGPFWVREASGGAYLQVVESAQVDLDDPDQRRIWESSTHFNPVMLVAALRRADGTAHRLTDHLDPMAVFVSEKPFAGRTIRVLEHPGLWNGAMAGWNTVFVEVPLSTFAPVKTILDLLRPAHQGV